MSISNEPPLPDLEFIRSKIKAENEDLIERANKLLASAGKAPESVGDEKTAERFVRLIDQIQKCENAIEANRVRLKEPYRNAADLVQDFHKQHMDPLVAAKKKLKDRQKAWDRRVAQEKAAAAEEKRKQAAAVLENAKDIEDLRKARHLQTEARHLGSDKSTRDAHGAASSLRKHWTYRVTDANKVPRLYLEVSATAINMAIDLGERDIPGLEIYEAEQSVVRG